MREARKRILLRFRARGRVDQRMEIVRFQDMAVRRNGAVQRQALENQRQFCAGADVDRRS
jgi:hypothetical protein